VYGLSLSGRNKLGDTDVYLSNLEGEIDFGNLKDAKLRIKSADISGLNAKFGQVSLRAALVSKNGFDGYVYANMSNINLYTEGNKKADLKFANDTTPTLHLKLTRSDFSIGFSSLDASIVFKNILNNSKLKLTQVGTTCEYDWGLSGSHEFIRDGNGVILVSDIGGQIDLCDWKNPEVTFHTLADFTNYNFSDNLNLGVVDVTRAEIKKTMAAKK